MICNKCGQLIPDGYRFCDRCGNPVASETQIVSAPEPMTPVMLNHTYYSAPKKFTWGDICSIVGFICSLVGIFFFWVILSPVALVTSLIGFIRNKTRKLAVAGLILTAVGLLIKTGLLLEQFNLLPNWLLTGLLG